MKPRTRKLLAELAIATCLVLAGPTVAILVARGQAAQFTSSSQTTDELAISELDRRTTSLENEQLDKRVALLERTEGDIVYIGASLFFITAAQLVALALGVFKRPQPMMSEDHIDQLARRLAAIHQDVPR